MMKKGWILAGFLLLLLALAAAALAACGGTSPLVGKWEHVEEEGAYIEFFKDGRWEIFDDSDAMSGTYEETGDKEVTLTPDEEFAEEPLALEYKISGDVLILTFQGAAETFTRVE